MNDPIVNHLIKKEGVNMEHNKYYRVFRVLTDKEGNIVHKTPIGRAKTMQGARALIAGTSGLMPTVIETVYY